MSAWKRHFCASAGVFEEIYQCVHRTKQIKKRSNCFFIEVQLFYSVVLVSAVQPASSIPIFPLVPASRLLPEEQLFELAQSELREGLGGEGNLFSAIKK